MVIITAGMIGVGKTTLTAKIADHLGTKAFFLNQLARIRYCHFTIQIQSSTVFFTANLFPKQTVFNDQASFEQ